MSRTNTELDDALVDRVMRRYGLRTKRAAIDLALRRLDLEPMSSEEALHRDVDFAAHAPLELVS